MRSYRLLHWVDESRLLNSSSSAYLSCNKSPGAIVLLAANPDKIHWSSLAANTAAGAGDLFALHFANSDSKYDGDEYDDDEENLWSIMSRNTNPKVIDILKANPDKIDWGVLSRNAAPEALELLLANPCNIDWGGMTMNENPAAAALVEAIPESNLWKWRGFCKNPSPTAVAIVLENPDKIEWECMSKNTNHRAVAYILENFPQNYVSEAEIEEAFNPMIGEGYNKIPGKNINNCLSWSALSSNTNPDIIKLLARFPENINWQKLCQNPSPDTAPILLAHQDKILWEVLCLGFNFASDALAELILANLDKVVWPALCFHRHPKIIELLSQNLDKVDWDVLAMNPAIFEEM